MVTKNRNQNSLNSLDVDITYTTNPFKKSKRNIEFSATNSNSSSSSYNRHNPCKNETDSITSPRLPLLEITKMILMTITGISIFRLIILVLSLIIGAFFLTLFMIGYSPHNDKDEFHDMGFIRKCLLTIPQLFSRLAMWALGYWYINEKYPTDHLTDNGSFDYQRFCDSLAEVKAKIFILNHVSYVDFLYILYKVIPFVVTNPDMLGIPIIGWAISALNPVIFGLTDKQRKELPSPTDELRRRLESLHCKRPVVIFPEGTTKHVSRCNIYNVVVYDY